MMGKNWIRNPRTCLAFLKKATCVYIFPTVHLLKPDQDCLDITLSLTELDRFLPVFRLLASLFLKHLFEKLKTVNYFSVPLKRMYISPSLFLVFEPRKYLSQVVGNHFFDMETSKETVPWHLSLRRMVGLQFLQLIMASKHTWLNYWEKYFQTQE